MTRLLVAALALSGCLRETGYTPSSVVADAMPDTLHCDVDPAVYTPIAVSGTTPSGPLEMFHYLAALRYAGSCLERYEIVLTPTMGGAYCQTDVLHLFIEGPFETTSVGDGTFAGSAYFDGSYDRHRASVATDQITFEVRAVDPPSQPNPRVSGRFVSKAAGWSIDLPVDLVASAGSCSLF
jgi:hypothetical protein